MSNFTPINDLPVFENLMEVYSKILHDCNLEYRDQICLNSIPSEPDDPFKGTRSIYYDWENSKRVVNADGNERVIVDKFKNPLEDADFTELCSQFKGTEFEELYIILKQRFEIGRVRLIRSKPKTCLSWHVDRTARLHFPINTQEGCFMIIQDEIKHLPRNTWWHTNTLTHHTALNGSWEDRVHLVVNLLSKKPSNPNQGTV